MPTVLADTFTSALGKLTGDEQKQVKLTVFDLQTEPDQPGLQFHRIDNSKDPNFWSVRVSRDIRIIVHKTAVAERSGQPGEVLTAENDRFEVAAGSGAVRLVTIQLVGKKPLGVAEFLRGHRLKPGDRLG